ncbi:acetoacetate--CoA ligase [Citricoccus sp. NPDC055426]|uniref:acetoacetate--CoA ligase n=1 Tax=Citricoccus sp. NPDC055426 TaxID=3155536 RepID=UPI00341A7CF8
MQNTSADPAAQSPAVTWTPDPGQVTNLSRFIDWVAEHRGTDLRTEDGRHDYRAVWQWSVDHLAEFWDAVREFHGVIGTGFTTDALVEPQMPGAVWYPEARLNFAENVLRWAADPQRAGTAAVVHISEENETVQITWAQLRDRTLALAARLRALGVRPGDRVAAVLPNVPEALVGLLAAASMGAVWTISSPDLSVTATLSRLRQLEPVVLIGTRGYRFNGKDLDYSAQLDQIAAGLPTVTTVLTEQDTQATAHDAGPAGSQPDVTGEDGAGETAAGFARVPFAHPLWILFSSGTTGDPKGIIHSHGGMLLEALKGSGLNQDMGPEDRYYVAANTSWMVWNTLVNNLATGASVVTYSGSPKAGDADRQFEIIERTGATMFATGAAYLSLVEKSGLVPGQRWDLSRLRSILSTGSPLPDSTWQWVHEAVRDQVHLGSDTGGTDICSGFIGSNPLEPVHLGELQGPLLGVDVQVWNEDGERVRGEVGEMVIRQPMPSMPVGLWNDPDGTRYRDTYFSVFPGSWVQGDWITETERGGFVVHGRSDATLNRQGVRLGSADIYSALQHVPEVVQSMVLGIEEPGGYYMPLYVQLAEGTELTAELEERIRRTIRERASARHVPDAVLTAPGVPVTHAGKRIEVPLKRVFTGRPAEQAINRGSLANPEAVEFFLTEAAAYRSSITQPPGAK